jgi:8-oxo-dGTP pyrophosphatase MutT (NUDIX family)
MDSQVDVKAVIQNADSLFLIVREGSRWQAVGGRLEPGEKLEDGLRRETLEETGITNMMVGRVVHVDEWFAKPEGVQKHIVALFFYCKVESDTVILSDEHQEYAWVTVDELSKYDGAIEKEIKLAIEIAAAS